MSNINSDEERLKQKKMGIHWQLVAESLNRDDVERFELLKKLFEIESVEDNISDHFLTWIENIIQEQFKLRMQIKNMMETGIEDAITINSLRYGPEPI